MLKLFTNHKFALGIPVIKIEGTRPCLYAMKPCLFIISIFGFFTKRKSKAVQCLASRI